MRLIEDNALIDARGRMFCLACAEAREITGRVTTIGGNTDEDKCDGCEKGPEYQARPTYIEGAGPTGVCTVTEYGLTQRLSATILVF
jgi:hypothetical protein